MIKISEETVRAGARIEVLSGVGGGTGVTAWVGATAKAGTEEGTGLTAATRSSDLIFS